MSLSALSDELLLEITRWVATDDYIPGYEFVARQRTKFLRPLALCSRRLHRIANPILYQTLAQTGGQALPAFLRLLESRPERGAYVKAFVVSDHSEEERMDMKDFSRLNLDTLGVGLKLVDYFLLKKPRWVSDLEDGNWQAAVALLLLLLPARPGRSRHCIVLHAIRIRIYRNSPRICRSSATKQPLPILLAKSH
jgi:hypothetical protein